MEFDHARPSTSRENPMPHIIPETQTSSDTMQENESQLISVSQLNIDMEVGEFVEEFDSNIAVVGMRNPAQKQGKNDFNESSVLKNFDNADLLTNILKLNKNITIELNNCSGITFNNVIKKDN